MEAKRAYERSVNLQPNYFPAYLGLASCSLKEGQPRSAENYATQAVRIEPRNRDANLLLATAYYENENYLAAYGQLLSISKFIQTDADVQLLMGKITYARRMHKDALQALSTARSAGLASSELFLFLGLTTLALEDYDEADTYFHLSIYKNKEEWRAWKGLGDTYIKQEKWQDAIEAYAAAGAIESENLEIQLGAGLAYLNSDRFNEAIATLERITSSDHPPPRAYYYLGYSYLRSGKTEQAKEAFRNFLINWEGDRALIQEVQSILDTL
jgi:tetratricopeptide (TPR) repeat protein